jgi:heme/copper-type cytochrome/quinol oxidase subunit 2
MKYNIFQKIAFFVYSLALLIILTCLVPYKDVYDPKIRENNLETFHDSIFSIYGTICYFRFLIYLVIPSIIFYFILKYLRNMNELERHLYLKKAKTELYIFCFLISIIFFVFMFFVISNKYNEISKQKLDNQFQIVLAKKRHNHIVFDNEYVDDNKLYSYNQLLDKVVNQSLDIDEYYFDIKKVTREKLFHTDNDLYVRESEYVNPYSDFFIYNFYEKYEELILNKKIFDVKVEKYPTVLIENQEQVSKLTFYSIKEIKEFIVYTFFALTFILYAIRPFFFSIKSMFFEVNKKY